MAAAQSENIKRIAKNTLLLYIRMLFGMLVSLYTSRVILNTLGVEDYGVYNVVGGVVAMFSIISNSLSVAVSRFLTFELGTGNRNKLQRIFFDFVNYTHCAGDNYFSCSGEYRGVVFEDADEYSGR